MTKAKIRSWPGISSSHWEPDEDDINNRLPEWGYEHKAVNHGAGVFARDEDGDGFHEIHVNTLEGYWSLLRSWLRPAGLATTSPINFTLQRRF